VTNTTVRYLYDGNVAIQEREANNLPQVTYTRGRDLSGSLQGAGGVGGLLARTDNSLTLNSQLSTSAHAYYHCDGNGNVTALVNTNGVVVAKYEYDPFGNILAMSGPMANANLYRFSSKEVHANSGLYYYGFRFYSPSLQRWMNRDPLGDWGGLVWSTIGSFDDRGTLIRPKSDSFGEFGGLNLFEYVYNNPAQYVDALGLGVYFCGNPASLKPLEDAYNRVKGTPRGKKLCEKLEKSKNTYEIKPTKDDAYFDPNTKSVNIDPDFHPETPTTQGIQPAPTDAVMGHELGHAATGTKDDGKGNMNNVNQNENPIRKCLGEPARTQY